MSCSHAHFRLCGDILICWRRRVGGSGCANTESRPVQRDGDQRGHSDGGPDGRCAGPRHVSPAAADDSLRPPHLNLSADRRKVCVPRLEPQCPESAEVDPTSVANDAAEPRNPCGSAQGQQPVVLRLRSMSCMFRQIGLASVPLPHRARPAQLRSGLLSEALALIDLLVLVGAERFTGFGTSTFSWAVQEYRCRVDCSSPHASTRFPGIVRSPAPQIQPQHSVQCCQQAGGCKRPGARYCTSASMEH